MNFVISVITHLLAMIIARILFMVVAAFIFLLIVTRLFAQEPSDYLYVTDLEFDANSGAATTTWMMPVPVNALNYVNSMLIRGDGTDRVFTDTDDVVVSGFTQDMTINAANWWVYATVTPSNITTQKVFHGGTDADLGFPIVQNNIGAGIFSTSIQPLLRATSTATLEIGDLLDVRIDIEANVPCGWIAGKQGNFYESPDGWQIFAIGTIEQSPSSGGVGGVFNGDEIFFEITPRNFDIWLCSIGDVTTALTLQRGTGGDITINIVDVDTGAQICNSKRVPVTFSISQIPIPDGELLLPKPCLIQQGQHARIFMRQNGNPTWATDDNGLNPVNSTNFTWEINAGCPIGPGCDIGGAEPWSRTSTQDITISFINASSSTAPNATGDLIAIIDDVQATSNSNWDGSRATIQLTYNDPTINILLDTIVVGSAAHAGGIATSTFELRIARGLGEGILHNFEIDAGVTTILDVDFDGDDITQTVVGDVSNSHLWRGTIQDESGSNNDLEYLLTANMTNINGSVSGFQDNPTPTPTAGEIGTSTALLGLPSINPFFTPVPTPAGGLIMGNLKSGAAASTLPVEAWWMLLSIIILAVALGLVHKFFPNKPIIAALAVFGIAIVSLAVGEDFRMWIVAIFAVWAFGSTGLYILWAR